MAKRLAVSLPIPIYEFISQAGGVPDVAPVMRITLPVISTSGAGLLRAIWASTSSALKRLYNPLMFSEKLKWAIMERKQTETEPIQFFKQIHHDAITRRMRITRCLHM